MRPLSAGSRRALLCGVAGLALLVGLTAPVTMDGANSSVGVKSAFAAGQGSGIGGGTDRVKPFPGKSNNGNRNGDDDDDGPGDTGGGDDDDDTGGGDDDDDDDTGGDDTGGDDTGGDDTGGDDTGGDDTGGGDDDDDTGGDDDDDDTGGDDTGGDGPGDTGGGRSAGAGSAGENHGGGAAADVASVANFEAIQAIEGAPAASLPTVQEIFALPDDAVLSNADEMRLISQGWGKPAE